MKKIYLIIIPLFIMICFFWLWNEINMKNKMAIFVNNPDPNYLYDKVWFDASKWLNSGDYIKINDFYLIKLKPINLNQVKNSEYFMYYDIYYNIRHRTYGDLDRTANFNELVQKVIGPADIQGETDAKTDLEGTERLSKLISHPEYEYLYSRFDKKKRQPVIDTLLVSFSYKDKKYEMVISAVIDEEDKKDQFPYSDILLARGIQHHGSFYKANDLLTYKLYLEEKQKEKK
ncbi:hypothetical protein Ppb6_03429 [Photorhabdus australis subsp. thailandensis]|uniref:Uncharacterized protein n=1 Tax=Photorhabdus australis subsp. thailandensis TaxID=2805096 RepID=A0A1C0U0E2_9GAMM|nr:hypothetical protein [Photorhabdus australis]OCQ51389.1 hypothetical protein Ppb6_03429 [Photorhabdus australis subsp. thailandensis]